MKTAMRARHWLRRSIAPAMLLATLCVALQAHTEPMVNESVAYYDVSADTLGTLLLELQSEVPLRPGGKVFHGYTTSKVVWHWRFRERGGRCTIHRAQAQVNIAMTLPRLVHTAAGSEVERVWKRWYPALRRHERQHANNAVQLARRGETRLLALPPMRDCELLNEEARRFSTRLLEELKQIDQEYDRRTRHGETEGAALLAYLPQKARAN